MSMQNEMEEIRTFIMENKELIEEEMEYAAKVSFNISEFCDGNDELISVILTDEFELETIRHHQSYSFTTDVLYVLYSFECHTYFVEYEDIEHFLNGEQWSLFEEFVIENNKDVFELLNLDEEELEEFNEMCLNEMLNKVFDELNIEYSLLELVSDFDKNIYDAFLKNLYDEVGPNLDIGYAIDGMLDKLSCYF